MEIHWEDDTLKKRLEDNKWLEKTYDEKVGRNIAQRLVEIDNSKHYGKLPPYAHPHPIKEGKKFLYYAVDVSGRGEGRGRLRLLFRPYGEHDLARVETITAVVILGLEDYH